MISAESGWEDLVVAFLDMGFDVNSTVGPYSAASLAYDNGHYDTLLTLFNANSKFPEYFDPEICEHDGLTQFDGMMTEFHNYILAQDTENLQKIIEDQPDLKYYFKNGGNSAAFETINKVLFKSYELLLTQNISLSPDESFEEAIAALTDEQKEQLRLIHERHSVALPNNHLMIIHGSLFIGHDVVEADQDERLGIAQEAINFLDEIPPIHSILKLIARAGGFKIILDFNREHIQFMNPSSSSTTRGLYCTTFHIYIAAKNLTDNTKKYQVYGTIAHEMCHFAMDLVYNNACIPYKDADKKTIGKEYFEILFQCRAITTEEIVGLVWNYDNKFQFAELIVRVPHMIAFYADDQVTLNVRREEYKSLFNFYETRVWPDIVKKIPTIGTEISKRRMQFYDETVKKVSKWRRISKYLLYLIPIAIVLASITTFKIVFEPKMQFYNLSIDDQNKVMNGDVNFVGIFLKFHDLYKNDSEIYTSLSSDQLKTLIRDEVLDLSDPLNDHLKNYIFLSFSNLTESLTQKFNNSCVNFQHNEIIIDDLFSGDDKRQEIFELFNTTQVFQMIKNESCLNIHIENVNDTSVFIERELIERNLLSEDIFTSYLKTDQQVPIVEKNIYNVAKEIKFVLLSDDAGTGKTKILKHMTAHFQQEFPHKWASFVPLRDKIDDLEYFQHHFGNITGILVKLLNLTELEGTVFSHFYELDRVILLWDGFDEISPDYSDVVLKIISNITDNTENYQWLSTRPVYEKNITNYDGFQNLQRIFRFLPYTEENNDEFLRKFFTLNKLNETQALKSMLLVKNITLKIDQYSETKSFIESPLLLSIIAEMSIDEEKDITTIGTINLYTIYNKFMLKKLKLIHEEGKIVIEDTDKAQMKATHPTFEQYQYFALENIFESLITSHVYDLQFEKKDLVILEKYKNFKFDKNELSRHGILIFDHRDKPDFIHKTFYEFFIVKYIVDYVYEDSAEKHQIECENRIKLFFKLIRKEEKTKKIREFIRNYIDSYNGELIQNKNTRNAMREGFSKNPDNGIGGFYVPFKNDTELVAWMWAIDKNETYITYLINTWLADKSYSSSEEFNSYYTRIVNVVYSVFTDKEDLENLLMGKNQRGTFLFTIWEFTPKNLFQDFLNISNVNNVDVNKLNNCLTFTQFFEFAITTLTHDEMREMFLKYFFYIVAKKIDTPTILTEIWPKIEKYFNRYEIVELLTAQRNSYRFEDIFRVLFCLDDVEFNNVIVSIYEKFVEDYQFIANISLLIDSPFRKNTRSRIVYLLQNDGVFESVWRLVDKANVETKKNFLKPIFINEFDKNVFATFPNMTQLIIKLHKIYFDATELKEIMFMFLKLVEEQKVVDYALMTYTSITQLISGDLRKFILEVFDISGKQLFDETYKTLFVKVNRVYQFSYHEYLSKHSPLLAEMYKTRLQNGLTDEIFFIKT